MSGLKLSRKKVAQIMKGADSNMDGVIQFDELKMIIKAVMQPRVSLIQCIIIMRHIWHWLEMPLPELLMDENEDKCMETIKDWAILRLGYPERLGLHIKLRLREVTTVILSVHFRQDLPKSFDSYLLPWQKEARPA